MDAEKIATRALGAILVEDGAISHMLIKGWITDAIAAAVEAEREACAKVAESHKGSAAKRRLSRGLKLSHVHPDAQMEIVAEERGEDIAARIIAQAIRARKEGKANG